MHVQLLSMFPTYPHISMAIYIIHPINKNSLQLGVKKCEANQKQGYKQPKNLISRRAKKTKLFII